MKHPRPDAYVTLPAFLARTVVRIMTPTSIVLPLPVLRVAPVDMRNTFHGVLRAVGLTVRSKFSPLLICSATATLRTGDASGRSLRPVGFRPGVLTTTDPSMGTGLMPENEAGTGDIPGHFEPGRSGSKG